MLIKYNNLTIRSAIKEDAEVLCSWWNDGKVMAHAGFPKGLGTSTNNVEKQISEDVAGINERLIIEMEGVPSGEMSYRKVGTEIVEIGIKICDSSSRERGYGKCLLSMLIGYLFNDLGYKKIVLDTNLNNHRAQHVYEDLGFKKLRVNKDAWTDQVGQLQSSVDYELIKENFVDFRTYD